MRREADRQVALNLRSDWINLERRHVLYYARQHSVDPRGRGFSAGHHRRGQRRGGEYSQLIGNITAPRAPPRWRHHPPTPRHPRLRPPQPWTGWSVSKIAGAEWKALSAEKKKPFEIMALEKNKDPAAFHRFENSLPANIIAGIITYDDGLEPSQRLEDLGQLRLKATRSWPEGSPKELWDNLSGDAKSKFYLEQPIDESYNTMLKDKSLAIEYIYQKEKENYENKLRDELIKYTPLSVLST